jgi:hypothetical protein
MIVFVVKEFNYESSPIHGVFSSMLKAQEYCEKERGKWKDALSKPHLEVEEWEVEDV